MNRSKIKLLNNKKIRKTDTWVWIAILFVIFLGFANNYFIKVEASELYNLKILKILGILLGFYLIMSFIYRVYINPDKFEIMIGEGKGTNNKKEFANSTLNIEVRRKVKRMVFPIVIGGLVVLIAIIKLT